MSNTVIPCNHWRRKNCDSVSEDAVAFPTMVSQGDCQAESLITTAVPIPVVEGGKPELVTAAPGLSFSPTDKDNSDVVTVDHCILDMGHIDR